MVKTRKHILIIFIGLACFSSMANAQTKNPQILLTGIFHGDEVVARSGEKWLAMVPFDKGFTLAETRVRIELVKDEIIDRENEITGKKVSIELKKKALFLLREINAVKPGKVETIVAKPTPFEINKSILLRSGNNQIYNLSVVCEDSTPLTAENYKECSLILIVGTKSQKIMALPVYYPPNQQPVFASEAHPSLLWAGDIDKDGAVDLLLDLSNHYNISRPTLFLSSAVQKNNLVAKVAEFITYGD